MTDSFRYDIDMSEIYTELDRLADAPSASAVLALEGILAESFAETQMAVHIITGSLRTSAKLDSDFNDGVWSGHISYGGLAPGAVNDPVRYARYERHRGLDHDFLAPAVANSHRYGEVVGDFLLGRM